MSEPTDARPPTPQQDGVLVHLELTSGEHRFQIARLGAVRPAEVPILLRMAALVAERALLGERR